MSPDAIAPHEVAADHPATRPSLTLLAGRHRRAEGGHPWIYSNEIAMDAAAKTLPPGSLVTLRRADATPLGVAIFNPHTLLAARLLDRDTTRPVGRRFIARRIGRALKLRERLFAMPFYRLVHAEADGLPGLVVDRFGAVLVVQSNAVGMARLETIVLEALGELLSPEAIVLRNDSAARELEGLPAEARVARGGLDGPVTVHENGAIFRADLLAGQKTGWFFDQRDNRRFVAALARGARVLDLYCFTGGFAVQAARAGAVAVLGVDRSEPALALAVETAQLNGVADTCSFRRAEAFAEAARLAALGERFDIVIADPPAFAKSRKDVGAALRGYRKLARLAGSVTAGGGIMFVASCSFHVGAAEFAEAVRRGLADAGRAGRILRLAGADADHPIHPALPETAYLKTLTLALD
ncbi:MAG: class I SAM-dependent rRNA methyltransferase [Alphaproteobacteria bacterium]|nr:class I SAM-dependent rRNA methyltransferase [Alphaproteobacteria bacterium]MBV9686511.1 class I SAM-dependent rRNA methyltransferase [Alphaproteobacteria bacterium]